MASEGRKLDELKSSLYNCSMFYEVHMYAKCAL